MLLFFSFLVKHLIAKSIFSPSTQIFGYENRNLIDSFFDTAYCRVLSTIYLTDSQLIKKFNRIPMEN